jgi:FkbM family methyltransferase
MYGGKDNRKVSMPIKAAKCLSSMFWNYTLNPFRRRKYYAEFGTDRWLRENVFENKTDGVMVEVGGGLPRWMSQSRHWSISGWKVVVVEPNPKYAALHRRIGNDVREVGASECSGESLFTMFDAGPFRGGLSYSCLGVASPLDGYNSREVELLPSKTITVKVGRLDNIVSDLLKIDLLTIDVEGYELKVLNGFTPERFGFPVVVIENHGKDGSLHEQLNWMGYKLLHQIEYNEIWKREA